MEVFYDKLFKQKRYNVKAYEIGTDYIIVIFNGGAERNYLYTYNSTGQENVEKMKKMTESVYGLNSFISRFIKNHYARKW